MPRILSGRPTGMTLERRAERVGRAIADTFGHLGDTVTAEAKHILCERHAPGNKVFHGRHAHSALKALKEGRSGERRLSGQSFNRPCPFRVIVNFSQGGGDTVIGKPAQIARGEEAARSVDGDAQAIQLDVTDRASVSAAAARIQADVGRLDVLIQNAAISNTGRLAGQTVQNYAQTTTAGILNVDEMRAVWDVNVFGVLTVYQAMLPLLRATPGSRIVNVSSGGGSLAENSDPASALRASFGPIYPASKTALNALTVAMAIELEKDGIAVNAVSPGFIKTNLNAFQGTATVEDGAREIVRVALLGRDNPTGKFTRWEAEPIPW